MAEIEKEKSELSETAEPDVETEQSAQPPAPPPELGVEPDEPPSRGIFALLAGLSIFLVLVGVGLWQIFGLTSIAEIEVKDLTVDNQELLELRARDWGRLTQYESLDGGAYQIPIERAMKKLVDNPALIAPLASTGAQDAAASTADGGVTESDVAATQPGDEASKDPNVPVASASAALGKAPPTPSAPVSAEVRP